MQHGGGAVVDELAEFWQHGLMIIRKTGTSGYEDTWAVPAVEYGFYDGGLKQVRSATGDQIMSTAIVFLPIEKEYIPPGSLITAPSSFGGHQGKVIQCIRREIGDLPLPVHWEVIVE